MTWETLSEAIRNLTTGTGKYAGMSASAALTTAGKWGKVTTAVQQAQRAFGDKLLIALSPVLDKTLELAQGLIPWAEKAGQKVQEMAMFLLAAFETGQLGTLAWSSLKLAGMMLVDLVGRGFMAIGAKLSEAVQETVLTLGDKITLALPPVFTDGDKRNEAQERETARANGTYPKGKSLRTHFDGASTGLEKSIDELGARIPNLISNVHEYAEIMKIALGFEARNAGRGNAKTTLGNVIKTEEDEKDSAWNVGLPNPQLVRPDRGANPWLKKPWQPREWQGPLPEGESLADVAAAYAAQRPVAAAAGKAGGNFPGLDGLTNLQRGKGGGNFPGLDGLANLQKGKAARQPQQMSRVEDALMNDFNRQAAGKKSWQDWLGENGPAAGLSQERLGALRGLNPETGAAAEPEGGTGGGPDAAAEGDPYGDRGRKSSPFSRAEKSLMSGFNRQAGGRGKKSWQQWLGSSVRTAGMDPARLEALRGMDPEALSKTVTNRPNRTRQERQKHAADMRERQAGQGGDIGTSVRGIGSDVRVIKDHLSKLQVR